MYRFAKIGQDNIRAGVTTYWPREKDRSGEGLEVAI